MPPKNRTQKPEKKPRVTLKVGPMTQQRQASTRVAISLVPNKPARFTVYQNITVTLGTDKWDYSEAWPMSHKGQKHDTFLVPKERRDEKYKSVAYMWLEPGIVDATYKPGVLHDPDTPWGTAAGRNKKRKPPAGAKVTKRVTSLRWNKDGTMKPDEKRTTSFFWV